MDVVHETSAGAIVYTVREGVVHVLLLQAKSGYWTLPKGRVEPDESLIEAAKREVLEETGIAVATFHPDFHEQVYVEKQFETEYSKKVVHLFLAETTQVGRVSQEHKALQWVDADSAVDMIAEHYTKALAHAIKLLQS